MDAGFDCSTARDAISARMDGEAAPAESAAADTHLAGCADCRAWEARAHDLRRAVVLRHPIAPEELADRVLVRLSVPQVGAGEWIRYALGVVAAALVVLSAPSLLGLASEVGDHQSRHLGTFGVALGVGLLWAAIRPERAIGLIPLACALAVATTVAAVVDLGAGRTVALAEASHLLELIGLGLLWLLSGGMARFRHRARHLRVGRPAPVG